MLSARFRLPGLSLLALVSGLSPGSALAADGGAIRIFTPPPLVWDHAMGSSRPALAQTAIDFANLTGGIRFGMTPEEANARMPEPYPGMSWSALPRADEYPGDVRYFWARLDTAGPLRAGLSNCVGAGSYVVAVFSIKGLFRLSYRLFPDKSCPTVTEAARDIFGRYVTITRQIAESIRYRTGTAEVVDITDATAGFLIPIHWRQSGK